MLPGLFTPSTRVDLWNMYTRSKEPVVLVLLISLHVASRDMSVAASRMGRLGVPLSLTSVPIKGLDFSWNRSSPHLKQYPSGIEENDMGADRGMLHTYVVSMTLR